MADQRISQLTALAANSNLLLPYSLSTVLIPLATQVNVANAKANIYQLLVSTSLLFQSTVQDLKTLASISLAVPSGFRFYVEECYVVATTINTATAQPIVSFGNGTDAVKYVDNLQTTFLTVSNSRERIAVNGNDGETVLTAVVDVVASATLFSGRFGFRGILFPI